MTLFLHSPLSAIAVLGKIKEIPYHLWETGQAFVDRFLAEASRLLTRAKGLGMQYPLLILCQRNIYVYSMSRNIGILCQQWNAIFLHASINLLYFFALLLTETSYIPFLGDDFLRLLLLRFIFCCVALRLHRAFKHWPALLPRSQPPLPEADLILQPSLERAMYTLIDHLELSNVFIEPREIL